MIGSPASCAGQWVEDRPGRARFLAVTLIGLGTLLRIGSLGAKSLWLDEAIIARFATLDLAIVLVAAQSELGGLAHHLGLNLWARLLGNSEFSLRLLSALPSILGLALIYQVTKLTLGTHKALLVTLLLAISPLDIWYAQEVRMYAQATFLALLCLYCYLRFRRSGRHLSLLVYVLAAILGIYTLYSFPLILLLLNGHLALLWLWQGERPRSTWAWLCAQLAILLGVLPWAPTWARQIRMIAASPGRWQTMSRLSGLLARWPFLQTRIWWLLGMGMLVGCLLAVALAFWGRRRADRMTRYLSSPWGALLWGLAPYLGLVAIASWRPNSSIRQLALFVPWTILAAVASLRYLRRWRRWLVAWMVVLALLGAAKNLGFTEKEGWRDAVAYVSAQVEARDLILTHAYYTLPAFNYYYAGPVPARSAPRGRELDGRLPQAVQGYARIWLVLSHEVYEDPQGRAERWLDSRYALVSQRAWQGIRVRLYQGPASAP